MSYFLVTCSEDGLDIEHYLDGNALLKRLKEREDVDDIDLTPKVFLDQLPEINQGYWDAEDDTMLIIKGEIIQPLFKQVVTKIELPE